MRKGLNNRTDEVKVSADRYQSQVWVDVGQTTASSCLPGTYTSLHHSICPLPAAVQKHSFSGWIIHCANTLPSETCKNRELTCLKKLVTVRVAGRKLVKLHVSSPTLILSNPFFFLSFHVPLRSVRMTKCCLLYNSGMQLRLGDTFIFNITLLAI